MTEKTPPPQIVEFTSPEQITSRPMYRPDLQMSADDLERIVGKYDLRTTTNPRPMVCGLNGCHEAHGKGFLIRAKNGAETVCGHLCGARHLNQRWDEIYATFQRESEAQSRLAVATQMHADQVLLRDRATALLAPCQRAEAAVEGLLGSLRLHRPLLKQIETSARSGGSIYIATSNSVLSAGSQQPKTMVRAAILAGSGLLTTNPTHFSKIIALRVLPWCDLCASIEKVSSLEPTEIATLARDGASHRETMRKAQSFLDEAYALFDIENLRKLELIRVHLLRSRDDTQELRWMLTDLVKKPRLIKASAT